MFLKKEFCQSNRIHVANVFDLGSILAADQPAELLEIVGERLDGLDSQKWSSEKTKALSSVIEKFYANIEAYEEEKLEEYGKRTRLQNWEQQELITEALYLNNVEGMVVQLRMSGRGYTVTDGKIEEGHYAIYDYLQYSHFIYVTDLSEIQPQAEIFVNKMVGLLKEQAIANWEKSNA